MIVSFDTSTLIKIYLEEAGTPDARSLWSMAMPASGSVLLFPEMMATFARKLREGADANKIAAARDAFETDWRSFAPVPLDANLNPICRRLVDEHPLRGAYAVHLASALVVQQAAGEPVFFACADIKLLNAAAKEGLRIEVGQ